MVLIKFLKAPVGRRGPQGDRISRSPLRRPAFGDPAGHTVEGRSGGPGGGHSLPGDSAHGPGTGHNDNGHNEHLQWAAAPRSREKIVPYSVRFPLVWGRRTSRDPRKTHLLASRAPSQQPQLPPPTGTALAVEGTRGTPARVPAGATQEAAWVLTGLSCTKPALLHPTPSGHHPGFPPVPILSFVS